MISGQKTARESLDSSLENPAMPFALPEDLSFVTIKFVVAFLVAGDVHQFQIIHSEQEPVKVFPVHLPSTLVLESFCQSGKNGSFLFNYMIQVPGAEKYPAFPVPIGIDGMSAQAHLGVKRTLAGEPAIRCAQGDFLIFCPVKIIAIVPLRLQFL